MKSFTCVNCKNKFSLNESQYEFFIEAKTKGMSLIMVECNNCGSSTGINPLLESENDNDKETVWRTPLAGIIGFVSHVDDGEKSYYGCGETGVIWESKEELNDSIEEIVKKFSHRNGCYKKVNGNWIPLEEEQENIEELILAIEKEG